LLRDNVAMIVSRIAPAPALRTSRLRVAVALVVGLAGAAIALPACDGGAASPADGGVDAGAGSGGHTGSGGGTGSGGHVSAGTGGEAPGSTCPTTAPAPASGCLSSGYQCYYEDCAGAGRTLATCTGGTWNVETGPCGTSRCSATPVSMTCAYGQICVVLEGGAVIAMCAANPCGTGPLDFRCLPAQYATCSVQGSIANGATITCNGCPTQTCP
jgi:hypothetical protein